MDCQLYDYDGLKKRLRKAEKERPFTEKDETEFVELLDNNLEKVIRDKNKNRVFTDKNLGLCFPSRKN